MEGKPFEKDSKIRIAASILWSVGFLLSAFSGGIKALSLFLCGLAFVGIWMSCLDSWKTNVKLRKAGFFSVALAVLCMVRILPVRSSYLLGSVWNIRWVTGLSLALPVLTWIGEAALFFFLLDGVCAQAALKEADCEKAHKIWTHFLSALFVTAVFQALSFVYLNYMQRAAVLTYINTLFLICALLFSLSARVRLVLFLYRTGCR